MENFLSATFSDTLRFNGNQVLRNILLILETTYIPSHVPGVPKKYKRLNSYCEGKLKSTVFIVSISYNEISI